MYVHFDKGLSMVASEDPACPQPQELQGAVGALADKLAQLGTKVDRSHEELMRRIDSVHQFMLGESVLGRYATAKFEQRISALEERISALEKNR
jgi:hypothetical protein